MNQRSTCYFFAGCFAIIAALSIADYGDGARDWLFVAVGTIGAVGFLIKGLRAGKSKAG